MSHDIKTSYNKHIIISNLFEKYRSYLYRIDDSEYFANNNFKMIYVIKGQVSISIGDRIARLEQSNLYYLGPDTCFKILKDTDMNTILILDIKKEYMDRISNVDYGDSLYQIRDHGDKQEIVGLMGEIYLMTFNHEWNTLKSDNKVDELLSIVYAGSKDSRILTLDLVEDGSVEATIYKITKSLNRDIKNSYGLDISLNDISEDYNINYYYLSRQFKEITGQNYTDYLLSIKLNKAVDLLINTGYKIIDIAKISNFTNAKSFNSHFKNIFHTTPTEFRSKYRNLQDTILKDSIHQEEETKLFFKELLNEDIRYFKTIIKNSYKLDLAGPAIASLENWDNIVDLNNISDLSEDFYKIEDIFDTSYITNLIINISIEDNNLYLCLKNKERIRIDSFKFKYIVDRAYRSGCNIMLIFTTEVDNNREELDVNRGLIHDILGILSGIIGYEGLDRLHFGLNILNIRELILEGEGQLIGDYIEGYKTSIRSKLGKDFNWISYLTAISKSEDLDLYKRLLEEIEIGPRDKFLLGIDYEHDLEDYDKSIDRHVGLVEEFKKEISYNNDLIIGFNYDISNIDLDNDMVLNYVTLFCLYLYLKLMEKGYKIGYINYEKILEGEKRKLEKYTHDRLNVETPEYHITSMVKSFGRDIILNDNGIIVTREGEDVYIFLYDNIYELYKYITSNLVVKMDKSIEYSLELLGLEGKYKIIEYGFSMLDRTPEILDEYIINISDKEKELLNYSNMPRVDISIENFNGRGFYMENRKILDIRYIQMKRI